MSYRCIFCCCPNDPAYSECVNCGATDWKLAHANISCRCVSDGVHPTRRKNCPLHGNSGGAERHVGPQPVCVVCGKPISLVEVPVCDGCKPVGPLDERL
jgi:hypothetical protein